MWHRVAQRLNCTVSEAQERLSFRDFALECEVYKREPWGCEADDVRLALLRATLVAVNSGKKGKKIKPADFLPEWQKKRRKKGPLDPRVIHAAMMSLARSCEGEEGQPVAPPEAVPMPKPPVPPQSAQPVRQPRKRKGG